MEICRGCRIIVTLSFALVLITSSHACFIRNCPPGGKRSMDILPRASRQCMACGPTLEGQCVGPSICCGSFGCLFGTQEAFVCEKENDSTSPCEVRGEACGARGQGNCVASGICCDAGACSFNSKCRANSTKGNQQLLTLLNQLLQNGDYSD